MKEKGDFALFPRVPGSIEKPEPGAKRILSGMVADALALVKRELPSKRDVHVLMAGSPEFSECFGFMVLGEDDRLKTHFDFHFHPCQRMDDLAAALKQGKFDLALVQLHNAPPVERQFTDKREDLLRMERLLAVNTWIVWAGLEVASFLHSVHGIPVVMVSDTGGEEAEKLLAAQVGARALFPWFDMNFQAFRECVRGILKDADKPAKTRSPRIVMMNTELGPLESWEIILRASYRAAELVLFQDSITAWQELSQKDPDLLITATWFFDLRAKEIAGRLMDRKATYPIIVMSAYEPEELWVREYASRGLNIKYLDIPFDATTFRNLVASSLNIPPDKNHEH